jgi:hypothetical protein
MLVALAFAATLAWWDGAAQGQTQFRSDLDGAQETPPVSTFAGGYAKFTLNANDTLTYDVRTWIVNGTAANIRVGGVGVAGPLLFSLTGGPTSWSGTTSALTATDKTNLRSSGLYVEVESALSPSGEIRGQIGPLPQLFGAHLTGDQEVSPTGSSATGEATFQVNSDRTITYNLTTSGLTGTAAHIHTGAFGVGGGIVFGLTGGPTTWSGTTPAMSAAQFNTIQASGFYVNVHTAAFSNGEIRGQMVPTENPYGVGAPSSVGVPSLHAFGAAMRGGTLGLTLTNGLPSGTGLLIFSLTDGVGVLKKTVPYVLGAPLLIIPVPLDGTGGFSISDVIPDLSSSVDVYFQYFGFDVAGPNGPLYASNGVFVPIFDY